LCSPRLPEIAPRSRAIKRLPNERCRIGRPEGRSQRGFNSSFRRDKGVGASPFAGRVKLETGQESDLLLAIALSRALSGSREKRSPTRKEVIEAARKARLCACQMQAELQDRLARTAELLVALTGALELFRSHLQSLAAVPRAAGVFCHPGVPTDAEIATPR
jgi:hypothetical protein